MIKVNGEERAYIPGTTVAELLKDMGFPAARVAVERNGEIVPVKRYTLTELKDNDVLEVVSFVGGG